MASESKVDLKKDVDPTLLSARPAKAPSKNLWTPIGRIAFLALFEPKPTQKASASNPNPKKKYQLTLLIPPECNFDLLKQSAEETVASEWGEKSKDMKIKNPFLKAGDFKSEGFIPGWRFLRLNSDDKPSIAEPRNGVLHKLVEPDSDLIYPGRWATVSVNCFPYGGKKDDVNTGVSFGLKNIVLLNHDNSFSSRVKLEEEFEMPESMAKESGGAVSGHALDKMFD